MLIWNYLDSYLHIFHLCIRITFEKWKFTKCRKLAKKGCQKNLGKLGQQCHYTDDGETLHWPKYKHSKVQVWVQWFVSHYTLCFVKGSYTLQSIFLTLIHDTYEISLELTKVQLMCNLFGPQCQSMACFLSDLLNTHFKVGGLHEGCTP